MTSPQVRSPPICRGSDLPCGRLAGTLLPAHGGWMSSQADESVVDPWTVLRRLMSENRQLRSERDELRERLDALEHELGSRPIEGKRPDAEVADEAVERVPEHAPDRSQPGRSKADAPPLLALDSPVLETG